MFDTIIALQISCETSTSFVSQGSSNIGSSSSFAIAIASLGTSLIYGPTFTISPTAFLSLIS